MKPLGFGVAAVLTLCLQSTIAPRLEILGARPDWILVLVVAAALRGSPAEAVGGAWIIGLAADLMSVEHLGLLAVSYASASAIVVALRDELFIERAFTQIVATLLLGCMVRVGWLIYRHALYDTEVGLWHALVGEVVLGSVHTAAWSWVLRTPLRKMLGGRVFRASQGSASLHA
jgi:rod shape-determining protein MreD